MKRFPLTVMAALAMTASASASANLDCSAQDKNVELTVEAITSRDGKYLASLRGELQLASGIKLSFERSDVKSYNWGKNVALVLLKQTPQGAVEVRIYAKPKDEIELEGSYVVTLGKTKVSGKAQCSGG